MKILELETELVRKQDYINQHEATVVIKDARNEELARQMHVKRVQAYQALHGLFLMRKLVQRLSMQITTGDLELERQLRKRVTEQSVEI